MNFKLGSLAVFHAIYLRSVCIMEESSASGASCIVFAPSPLAALLPPPHGYLSVNSTYLYDARAHSRSMFVVVSCILLLIHNVPGLIYTLRTHALQLYRSTRTGAAVAHGHYCVLCERLRACAARYIGCNKSTKLRHETISHARALNVLVLLFLMGPCVCVCILVLFGGCCLVNNVRNICVYVGVASSAAAVASVARRRRHNKTVHTATV